MHDVRWMDIARLDTHFSPVLCFLCCSGDIYCFNCSQRTLLCPDYTLSLHTPQRCCSFCFGRENADYLQDVLISSDKKTELMVVLQDLFRKSSLKSIEVDFANTFTLNVREHNPQSPASIWQQRTITFEQSKGAKEKDFTPTNETAATVKVAPGLAPDFVKQSQRRLEKRRAATAARQEIEREERQRRGKEREAERAQERKLRLAEKKAAKADAKAAKEQQEQHRSGAVSVSVSSSSSSSRSKIAAKPVAAPNPSAPACSSCGCDSFTAHMFKKGQCASCHHVH
jgi:hypothetical protein